MVFVVAREVEMNVLMREGKLVREWRNLKPEKAQFYSPDTLVVVYVF